MDSRLKEACKGSSFMQKGLNLPEFRSQMTQLLPASYAEKIKKAKRAELEQLCQSFFPNEFATVVKPSQLKNKSVTMAKKPAALELPFPNWELAKDALTKYVAENMWDENGKRRKDFSNEQAKLEYYSPWKQFAADFAVHLRNNKEFRDMVQNDLRDSKSDDIEKMERHVVMDNLGYFTHEVIEYLQGLGYKFEPIAANEAKKYKGNDPLILVDYTYNPTKHFILIE